MKICSKCSEEKDLSQFFFRKDKQIYQSWCKACNALRNKKWRSENRESYNASCAEWRTKTMEIQRLNRKEWQTENKEKINASNRKSYHKAKENDQFEWFIEQLESQTE